VRRDEVLEHRQAFTVWSRDPREPESNIMNTGLNPSFDSRMARTIASATSLLAWVQVSMTLL
jgi:hypothetical protein